ncbi:MAG TPA: DUF2752 domain-containing protein [Jatrophihabitans sp.]|nr:DUF2752 domain-containing protein [Jatrophihabitans sp.]
MTAGTRTPSLPAVTAGLFAVAGLCLVNPNTTHIPLCPLHAATGLWCPLCGTIRAGYALLHGQWSTALHDNLLVLALAPLLLGAWWRQAGRDPSTDRAGLLPRPVFGAVLVLAVLFGVLRNLPIGSWLAPPA